MWEHPDRFFKPREFKPFKFILKVVRKRNTLKQLVQ